MYGILRRDLIRCHVMFRLQEILQNRMNRQLDFILSYMVLRNLLIKQNFLDSFLGTYNL